MNNPSLESLPALPTLVTGLSTPTVPSAQGNPDPTAEIADGPQPRPNLMLDESVQLNTQGAPGAGFVFDADAGMPISLDVALLDGVTGYELSLIDKFHNVLASVRGGNEAPAQSISELTLPYSGSYNVLVAALSGSGTVSIQAYRLEEATGGGVFDQVTVLRAAQMEDAHVYHRYELELTAGEAVTIAARALGEGNLSLDLRLYGPDGRFVQSANDTNATGETDAVIPGYIPAFDGTHIVMVANANGARGTYEFEVSPDSTPPSATGVPDIAFDNPYRASFSSGSNLSVSFDGVVGDVIRVDMLEVPRSLDVGLYLYGPYGQMLAYAVSASAGNSESLAEAQLPYTGRYRLELQPNGNGEAGLIVSRLETSSLTGGGRWGDTFRDVRTARIQAASVFHTYQLNARVGDMISISVTSFSDDERRPLDLVFAVLDPAGRQIVFADNPAFSASRDPHLESFEVAQTGVFTVIVYSFTAATGSYEIAYTRN